MDSMADEQPSLLGVSEHQLQIDGWKERCGIVPQPQQLIVPVLLDGWALSSVARHVLVVVIVVAGRGTSSNPRVCWASASSQCGWSGGSTSLLHAQTRSSPDPPPHRETAIYFFS